MDNRLGLNIVVVVVFSFVRVTKTKAKTEERKKIVLNSLKSDLQTLNLIELIRVC